MMDLSKKNISEKLEDILLNKMVVDRHNICSYNVYLATVELVKEIMGYKWRETKDRFSQGKKMYYLSFEYLPESFLYRNILFLKLEDEIKYAISVLGFKLDEIIEYDICSRLGEGALGRFAFSFLDSSTSLNSNIMAYGIRYENGRLKQEIVDCNQVEKIDSWLESGFPWEYKRNIKYDIDFNEYKVTAQAYDIPILGYEAQTVSTLRVWSIVSSTQLDIDAVLKGDLNQLYLNYMKSKSLVSFLYPEDLTSEGKKIRLGQEYFFASCSIKDILNDLKREKLNLLKIEDYVNIRINENHTLMSIPVFIKEYREETNCSYDYAMEKVGKIFNYTAFENFANNKRTWQLNLIKEVCPSIITVIECISDKFKEFINNINIPIKEESYKNISIIDEDKVNFTNIALLLCHSINGISRMHYNIITNRNANCYSFLHPEKYFLNRAGTTQRTWLYLANRELTDYLNNYLNEDIIKNPKKLMNLLEYKDDKNLHLDINNIKNKQKEKVAKFVKDSNNILINPYSIYDMQLKNFLENRRQFLMAMYITKIFFELLDNSNIDIVDRTFFFGGIASQSYLAAKYTINYVNTLAKIVNKNLRIKNKIKIVFIENLTIEKMMKLIPSADINEQLSTPGLDMSGISAAKYMFNGGITIGSRTGINLDIRNEIGGNNIFLFGLSKEELDDQFKYNYYQPSGYMNENEDLLYLINKVRNSKFKDLIDSFDNILNIILKYNDSFSVLRDYSSYIRAQESIDFKYRDEKNWNNIQLINIANSGKFSVDYYSEFFKK